MRMRSIWRRAALAVALAASLAALSSALPAPAAAQSATEYSSFIEGVTFGAGHYRWLRLPSPHSSLCAQACYQDRRCIAWTYRGPIQGGDPVPYCYLHPRVTSEARNACCTSGVIYERRAGPRYAPGPYTPPTAQDYSTYRQSVTLGAGNYRWIKLPSPHSSLCAQYCYQDRRCIAWTYQSPESNNQQVPFCYLHPFIASVSAHSCCTSGSIRGRGGRF